MAEAKRALILDAALRVFARDDNGSLPDHDVQSALLSLPRLAVGNPSLEKSSIPFRRTA